MTANTEPEIRALLAFFGERGLPLILEGGHDAGEMAKEIEAAGVPVIVDVPYVPGSAPRDHGKGEDADWPRYDTASMLAAEGVPFALAVRGDRVYVGGEFRNIGGRPRHRLDSHVHPSLLLAFSPRFFWRTV